MSIVDNVIQWVCLNLLINCKWSYENISRQCDRTIARRKTPMLNFSWLIQFKVKAWRISTKLNYKWISWLIFLMFLSTPREKIFWWESAGAKMVFVSFDIYHNSKNLNHHKPNQKTMSQWRHKITSIQISGAEDSISRRMENGIF